MKHGIDIFKKNKIVRNISWTLMAKAVAMLLFFLTDIMTARLLTVSEYGEWNYFFSIKTMIAYIGYFGIDQGTKLVMAKLDNEEARAKCFKMGMLLRTIISTIVAVMVFATAKLWNEVLNQDGQYENLLWLLAFGGILAMFNAYQEFFKEIGYGIGDNKLVFIVTFAEYGIIFLSLLLIVLVYSNVYGMLLGYLTAGCVTLGGCLLYIQKKYGYFNKKKLKVKEPSYYKQILKYALPLLFANIANLVCMELDTTMIGLLSTSQEVAIYNVGKKLCTKAGHINLAIAGGTMAAFAIINHENYSKKIKTFFRVMLLDIIVTVIIGIGLVAVAQIGIPILYGEEYIGATSITMCMIPYYLMFGISSCLALFLDFRNKSIIRSIVSIICIVLDAGLNYIFIRKFGAIGAVYTTVLTQVPYFIFTIAASFCEIKSIKRQILK